MSMNAASSSRLATSSWSLHRALGMTYPDAPGKPNSGAVATYGPGSITLLDIPARLASMGIAGFEICHFHLPSRDPKYLDELRRALKSAGVELLTLLIDDGDMTHPDHGQRDLAWITGWIKTAGQLGAKRARVVAGKSQPSAETLERSKAGLTQLVEVGKSNEVRIITENWFDLLSTPDAVHQVMDQVDIGLLADFGNWKGPSKYDDLAAILPRAESCHAKCSFNAAGQPDREDYLRCLDLAREANYRGPYSLIYDGVGDDEWAGITIEKELVQPYI
jgi:sugar phosphate isomerase/epimerase